MSKEIQVCCEYCSPSVSVGFHIATREWSFFCQSGERSREVVNYPGECHNHLFLFFHVFHQFPVGEFTLHFSVSSLLLFLFSLL